VNVRHYRPFDRRDGTAETIGGSISDKPLNADRLQRPLPTRWRKLAGQLKATVAAPHQVEGTVLRLALPDAHEDPVEATDYGRPNYASCIASFDRD
jgi:hypothetical protein